MPSSIRQIRWQLFALGLFAALPPTAMAQTYGTDRGNCDRTSISHAFDSSQGNIVGSLLGAAGGGLLGNQFGHGSGKSAMTVLGVVGGALAGGTIGRSMEPADQACVGRTLEYGQSGQPVAWQNPDNQTTYNVTPQPAYEYQGQQCRDYQTTAVIDGQQQVINGRACRQPDGSWKQG